jgi:hypothetical protein
MQLKYRTMLLSLLSLLAVLWASGLAVPAAAAEVDKVPFLNGGVGNDQQQAMQAVHQDYNWLLTFATRGSGARQ